jgi:hypothetical protein
MMCDVVSHSGSFGKGCCIILATRIAFVVLGNTFLYINHIFVKILPVTRIKSVNTFMYLLYFVIPLFALLFLLLDS